MKFFMFVFFYIQMIYSEKQSVLESLKDNLPILSSSGITHDVGNLDLLKFYDLNNKSSEEEDNDELENGEKES